MKPPSPTAQVVGAAARVLLEPVDGQASDFAVACPEEIRAYVKTAPAAGTPLDPFETFDDHDALLGALQETLGEVTPVSAMYVDDDNALVGRVNVSDVATLYKLRDDMLGPTFKTKLAEQLQKLRSHGGAEYQVQIDMTAFAERFECSWVNRSSLNEGVQT